MSTLASKHAQGKAPANRHWSGKSTFLTCLCDLFHQLVSLALNLIQLALLHIRKELDKNTKGLLFLLFQISGNSVALAAFLLARTSSSPPRIGTLHRVAIGLTSVVLPALFVAGKASLRKKVRLEIRSVLEGIIRGKKSLRYSRLLPNWMNEVGPI